MTIEKSTMIEKKTIADQLFDLEMEFITLEDSTFDKILICLDINPNEPTEWPLEGWTFDHYDYSFELTDVNVGWEPTEQQLKKCWELGFARCWVNYNDGTEQYYYKQAM